MMKIIKLWTKKSRNKLHCSALFRSSIHLLSTTIGARRFCCLEGVYQYNFMLLTAYCWV